MNVSPSEPVPADVLVVDDTPENLRLLATILVKEGYNVRKALNGTMALTAVQTVQPDLILLDIGLPTLDGIEVARQVRKLSPESKIVFLSQESSAEVVEEALNTGACGYVVKARAASELLRALDSAMLRR